MHREMKSGRDLLSAAAAGALGRRKRDPHRALGQERQSRARWAMWDEKGWMEMPTEQKHSRKRQKHPPGAGPGVEQCLLSEWGELSPKSPVRGWGWPGGSGEQGWDAAGVPAALGRQQPDLHGQIPVFAPFPKQHSSN